MIVTAGTGSGKTESFLLPVLGSLLAESAAWGGGPAPRSTPGGVPPAPSSPRSGTGRRVARKAVRALVLYPMNALVDDQLMRMRRALDSDAARTWLDTHRRGHRFYFGRYTGATPVTGFRTTETALERLRDILLATEQRGARAAQVAAETGNDDVRYFVPRLDGAEMRSRWDMADAPPDILITNYSMLNVMLLRDRDSHFFDSTRAWLEPDPDAPLHPGRRRAPHVPRHGGHRGRLPAPQPQAAARADRAPGPAPRPRGLGLARRRARPAVPRGVLRRRRRQLRVRSPAASPCPQSAPVGTAAHVVGRPRRGGATARRRRAASMD